jgi:hypothetical protein
VAEVTAFRHNALPYPIYAQPWAVVFPMLDADGDLVTGATTPDAERSLNGDTFADCTNESVEIATGSGVYYLLLTAAEMTADIVSVIAKSATAGMKTTVLTFYPRKLSTVRTGTAQAGAAGTITLDSGASAVDDYYNGCVIVGVLDSTTEVRVITDYVGSTKVASVTPNWIVTPDSDDTFTILMPEGRQVGLADVTAWLGTTPATPTVAGVPEVDLTHVAGSTTSVSTLASSMATLLADWINGGRLDLILDIIAADTTTDIPALIGTPAGASVSADIAVIEGQTDDIGAAGAGLTAVPWNAAWDAEVQSEVDDALNTAIAELGVAAPTATPTLRTGLMLLYMALRNKLTVATSGTDAIEIYNDAGTKICAKTITDDGSDYSEAKAG